MHPNSSSSAEMGNGADEDKVGDEESEVAKRTHSNSCSRPPLNRPLLRW